MAKQAVRVYFSNGNVSYSINRPSAYIRLIKISAERSSSMMNCGFFAHFLAASVLGCIGTPPLFYIVHSPEKRTPDQLSGKSTHANMLLK
jgi:hypothetical protein